MDCNETIPLYFILCRFECKPAHHIRDIVWRKILSLSRIAQTFRHVKFTEEVLFRIVRHICCCDRQQLRDSLLFIPGIFLNNQEIGILDALVVIDPVVECCGPQEHYVSPNLCAIPRNAHAIE